MIRQYYAARCMGGDNPLRIGIIAPGSIYYLQDQEFFSRFGGRATCRDPWIVESFVNGTVAAARRSKDSGMWEDVYFAGRSDAAIVRSLRSGRRVQVSVRLLILHDDLGLTKGITSYPTRPDMRLYRRNLRSKVSSPLLARAA